MNKKIVYSLVLTSIFVLSIASVAIQPAAGASFKFGVPDAAKGMKLQSEVKIYDKSTWGDCLGYCLDNSVNEKFGGDGTSANDVGARSQGEISDWESDDIWFFGDFLMKSDVPCRCDGSKVTFGDVELTDYWSAAEAVEVALRELGKCNASRTLSATPYGYPIDFKYYNPGWGHGNVVVLESAVAAALSNAIYVQYFGLGAFRPNWLLAGAGPSPALGSNYSIWQAMWDTSLLFEQSTFTREEISARYHREYEGVVLTRDSWDFAKDLTDLEDDPDEEDEEAPFIEEPQDLYDSFLYFNEFLNDEFALIDAMIYSLLAFNKTYHYAPSYDPWGGALAMGKINATVGAIIDQLLLAACGNDMPTFTATKGQLFPLGLWTDTVDTFLDILLCADGDHILNEGSMGVMGIVPFFVDETPQDDKEYLKMLFDGGIPAHQDVAHWLERLVDAFDIDDERWFGDDDVIYQDITLIYPTEATTHSPYAPKVATGVYVGDDLHTGGIEVDGLVVTCEMEWPEGLLNDPTDPDSQREDYEIVWTYGDTGGQSKTEYFEGDEVFYSIEGISPTIVGYEVSILLGAGAIATLGLIYVFIKKRRM